jgi:hypothetical protein
MLKEENFLIILLKIKEFKNPKQLDLCNKYYLEYNIFIKME